MFSVFRIGNYSDICVVWKSIHSCLDERKKGCLLKAAFSIRLGAIASYFQGFSYRVTTTFLVMVPSLPVNTK